MDCQNIDFMEFFDSMTFVMKYTTTSLDPYNYDQPMKSSTGDYFQPMRGDETTQIYLEFSPLIFENEATSILSSDDFDEKGILINSEKYSSKEKKSQNDSSFGINFRLGNIEKHIVRSYDGIMVVLANLGGFFSILKLGIRALIVYYTRKQMINDLGGELKDHTLQKKEKEEKNEEKKKKGLLTRIKRALQCLGIFGNKVFEEETKKKCDIVVILIKIKCFNYGKDYYEKVKAFSNMEVELASWRIRIGKKALSLESALNYKQKTEFPIIKENKHDINIYNKQKKEQDIIEKKNSTIIRNNRKCSWEFGNPITEEDNQQNNFSNRSILEISQRKPINDLIPQPKTLRYFNHN